MEHKDLFQTILIFLVTLSLTLFIICMVLHRAVFAYIKQRHMKKRLAFHGIEAKAVLLNMQHTGLYFNNRPQVVMQMQIRPGCGKNFVTETHELLPDSNLFLLHSGRPLLVRYNPSNKKEVMVVWNGLSAASF